MAESKMIKFDKANPKHVDSITKGNATIHSGGYFSNDKPAAKNNVESETRKTVAKKITTPRKLKPAPEPVKKEEKAPAKKTAPKKAQPKKK
jgi:hypothetical protein